MKYCVQNLTKIFQNHTKIFQNHDNWSIFTEVKAFKVKKKKKVKKTNKKTNIHFLYPIEIETALLPDRAQS